MDSAVSQAWSSDIKTTDSVHPVQSIRIPKKQATSTDQPDLDAMQQFSAISQHFINSYNQLERQVTHLSEELAKQTAEKEQKAQENAQLARRLQTILSTLPNGVVVIDGHGRVQQANSMAADMLGEPLEGAIWLDVISRAFAPRSDDGHEISLVDGRRVKVDTEAIESGPGQIVTLTDLTETRRLQENQSREQRLSAIGKMMASLAHQIRTPLSSALLYSGQLTSPRLSQDKLQEFQLHMRKSLKQLEHHVSDMLLFASGGVAKSQRFSVAELVKSLDVDVVQNLYGEVDIEINSNLKDTSSSFLYGNQQALCGAVSNLIENGIQACRDNAALGKLTSISLDIEGGNPQELCLVVTDNGCGIEHENHESIFDPFYTGKSRGTGLGLAVVKTVVTNFKGHVDVASEAGKGSQFVIRLPLVEQQSMGGS